MDSDDIFIYKDGVYEPNGCKILAAQIQKEYINHHPYEISNGFVEQVLGHIKRSTYVNLKEDEAPLHLLCLQNGVLNVSTFQTTPHTPDLIFFNKIPTTYNKTADCPGIKTFLSQ